MSGRLRAVLGVALMSALLILYFVFIGIRAFALLGSASLIAIVMGAAMLILPLIGLWALVRELQFGRGATRLVDRLSSEELLPEESVDVSPTGRPDREQAEEAFPRYRAAAEAHPESWQAWARLGIVYDACGDRKRARAAMRQAVACERASRVTQSTFD